MHMRRSRSIVIRNYASPFLLLLSSMYIFSPLDLLLDARIEREEAGSGSGHELMNMNMAGERSCYY